MVSNKTPKLAETIEAVPTRDGSPTYIRVPKDTDSDVKVGENVKYMVMGKVNSIKDVSMSDESQKKYQVELIAHSINSKEVRKQYPIYIQVLKDSAPELSIGDNFNAMLNGVVKNIQIGLLGNPPEEMREIELKGLEVSSLAMNPADHEMKRMVQ